MIVCGAENWKLFSRLDSSRVLRCIAGGDWVCACDLSGVLEGDGCGVVGVVLGWFCKVIFGGF